MKHNSFSLTRSESRVGSSKIGLSGLMHEKLEIKGFEDFWIIMILCLSLYRKKENDYWKFYYFYIAKKCKFRDLLMTFVWLLHNDHLNLTIFFSETIWHDSRIFSAILRQISQFFMRLTDEIDIFSRPFVKIRHIYLPFYWLNSLFLTAIFW